VDGLRMETAVRTGSEISIYYDPMIAKLIVWDKERTGAIRKLRYTLENLSCLGLQTNQSLLCKILVDQNFINGEFDTNYIDKKINHLTEGKQNPVQFHHAMIASTLSRWQMRADSRSLLSGIPPGWRNNFYQSIQDIYIHGNKEQLLSYRYASGRFTININDQVYNASIIKGTANEILVEIDGVRTAYTLIQRGQDIFLQNSISGTTQLSLKEKFPKKSIQNLEDAYVAPMPSQVIEVLVEVGKEIKEGDALIVLSSMKMENIIKATKPGTVTDIYVQKNRNIDANQVLLRIEE